MKFPFYKWQGAGNDFVLVEDFGREFSQDHEIIAKACHRQLGIGSDGLMLMQKSEKARLKALFFNSDGYEVSLCGNGLRCFFKHAHQRGFASASEKIETKDALYPCFLNGDEVVITMGQPLIQEWDFSIGGFDHGYFLNTGVPHLVFFVEELENLEVGKIGSSLRHHSYFKPQGTNVNFGKKNREGEIEVRTFERGVEKETLACGTGVVATAFVAKHLFNLKDTIEVRTRSSTCLQVSIDAKRQCTLQGPAELVYTGTYNFSF